MLIIVFSIRIPPQHQGRNGRTAKVKSDPSTGEGCPNEPDQ
jgi:hypothetical protein